MNYIFLLQQFDTELQVSEVKKQQWINPLWEPGETAGATFHHKLLEAMWGRAP